MEIRPLNNQWTWINGDSTFNSAVNRGAKGVPSAANQPGALVFATGWADLAGNLWLFGGPNTSNDLWRYSIQTGFWTWVHGGSPGGLSIFGTKGVPAPANVPISRYGGVGWTDASGNLWLCCGSNDNTLWKYDPSINQWAWMSGNGPNTNGPAYVFGTKGIANAANMPVRRLYASGWTDPSGNLWLFGGYSSIGQTSGDLNDLWKYSPLTGLWTWMSGDSVLLQPALFGTKGVSSSTNKPGAKEGAVSWMDAAGNLWLFGGGTNTNGSFKFFNDLWRYNPLLNEWTWMSGDSTLNEPGVYGTIGMAAPSNKPGARIHAAGWSDTAGRLWLFGGVRSNAAADYNELWQYTTSKASLPVHLISFTAQQKQQAVLLNWTTAREQNSREFFVERSVDGRVYTHISRVAASGTVNTLTRYTFTDAAPLAGDNFYRLKEVDMDGKFMYSAVEKINFKEAGAHMRVMINPVQNILRLQTWIPFAQQVTIEIRTAGGSLVLNKSFIASNGTALSEIAVDKLARGVYFVHAQSASLDNTCSFIKR